MAAALAGGSTYFISTRMQSGPVGPTLTKIVATAKELAPGFPLTRDDLKVIDWPETAVPPGSILKAEDAIGRPLVVSVVAGQPLLQTHLAAPGAGFGLAGKIPDGMRATAVRSNEIVGVAGFLYPGSRVDVVVAHNVPSSTGPQLATQTILQGVEVLAAGTAVEPDPQGRPQTVNVVTLLLTPEDSQKLLLAGAEGTIQFVLRSGTDKEIVSLPPTRVDQFYGGARPPEPAPPAPRPTTPARRQAPPKVEPAPAVAPVVQPPPPPPPPPAPYTIEVIQGTQRSQQKFEEK